MDVVLASENFISIKMKVELWSSKKSHSYPSHNTKNSVTFPAITYVIYGAVIFLQKKLVLCLSFAAWIGDDKTNAGHDFCYSVYQKGRENYQLCCLKVFPNKVLTQNIALFYFHKKHQVDFKHGALFFSQML